MKEKFGNGYLLFYERTGKYKVNTGENIERISFDLTQSEDLDHYKLIKSQNQKY